MPHPELAGVLEEGAAALGCELGDTQLRRLLAFLDLLEKWNAVYNLTSIRVPAQMVPLHLLDSLAIIGPWRRHLASVKTEPSTRWLDVGSGGGLPGVVMAILEPSLEITCVDAVGKKARFVQQVAAELGLSRLLAVHARVETMQGPRFDGITARAFATLDDLVRLTADRLVPNGVWLAMKGQRPEAEIRDVAARVDVFHVEPLRVPGLNAERCLVWMRPRLVS